MEWTDYLIDNVYIKVGDVSADYWHTYGNRLCSTISKSVHEYSYMKRLMANTLYMAKKFSDTVRYIDDLLTLNNLKFEEEIVSIYPPELTLKRTTESDTNLDISITIYCGRYVTEVYDTKQLFQTRIICKHKILFN